MRDDNIIDYSQIGKFEDVLTGILRDGAQWPSSGAPDPDRDRLGPGADSEGSFQRRQAGDLPLVGGSAACAQESHAGGLGALAVPEGGQHRRDGRRAVRAAGEAGEGVLAVGGQASQAGLAGREEEVDAA